MVRRPLLRIVWTDGTRTNGPGVGSACPLPGIEPARPAGTQAQGQW